MNLERRDGLCECGCGQRTAIAAKNSTEANMVKGRPMRFVQGHQGRYRQHRWEDSIDFTEACWEWTGSTNSDGYGNLSVNGRVVRAHRVFYEAFVGPIPEGRQLDHLCRNRVCVNPAHLEAVTLAENVRRGSQAKLSAERAAAIRARADETATALAAEFGVSVNTVCGVLNGAAWCDAEPESATSRRRRAAVLVECARVRLRRAAVELDGLGETGHSNALTAIVAADDVLDAIVHAEAADRTLAELERIS